MRKKDNRDHLFFHDLINHIHGMLLFLNYRMEDKKGFGISDCQKLVKELQVLQSLIQDHFGLTHKNLSSNHSYADISFIKKEVKNIIANFLPGKSCKIDFKGNHRGEIHYIAYCRIIGNIMKNMSESHAYGLEFVFNFKKDGLYLTTKNKIHFGKGKEDIKEGRGLLSVQNLCKEEGGEFLFLREGGFWINKVFLPWHSR